MRKIFIYPLLLISTLVLLSASSLAMQPLSNQEMDTTVASTGVDIAVNDAQFFMTQQGIWYQDTDGMSASVTSRMDSRDYSDNAGASIGFTGFEFSGDVNTITAYDPTQEETGGLVSYNRGLQGAYQYTLPWETTEVFEFSPVTIDIVSSLPGLGTLDQDNNFGVNIGISTMEIFISSFDTGLTMNDPAPFDGQDNLNAANKDKSFFGYEFGGSTTTSLRGDLEISPH